MTEKYLQIRLKNRPGSGSDDFWTMTNDNPSALEDHQVLLKMHYISLDPGMKGWMSDKKSYMPPVNLTEVMRAFGVGEVIDSRSDQFKIGQFVTGFTGAQSHAVVDTRGFLRLIDPDAAPLSHYMGGLGMTGFTGYFGMTDIGRPNTGETVVVSAAAGAVGSIACQVAKISGARVVGIAGGEEKCTLLTEEFGLDAAIDYKKGPIDEALKEACPDGIDVYFDNVGGDILDAVLMQMNRLARIVLCGGVSQYDNWHKAVGPTNYMQIVTQSLTMRGFTMMDYSAQIPEGSAQLAQWQREGEVTFLEHIVDGIENFPAAFETLFNGGNTGKMIIRL